MSSLQDVVEELPAPYGDPSALDAAAVTAAPILAGFSVVLVGLILEGRIGLWQKDLALFLLVTAILLLISSVEFAFTARRYYVPAQELWALLSLAEASKKEAEAGTDAERLARANTLCEGIPAAYLTMLPRQKVMATFGRYAYNLGIVCFLAAVGVTLIPVGGLHGVLRIAAVVLVGLAAAGELLWDFTSDAARWTPYRKIDLYGRRVRQRNPIAVGLLTLATALTYGVIWRYQVNAEMRDAGPAERRSRMWTAFGKMWDVVAAVLLTAFYYACILVLVMWLLGEWRPHLWWATCLVGLAFVTRTTRRLRSAQVQLALRRRYHFTAWLANFLLFALPPLWYSRIQVDLNQVWSEVATRQEPSGPPARFPDGFEAVGGIVERLGEVVGGQLTTVWSAIKRSVEAREAARAARRPAAPPVAQEVLLDQSEPDASAKSPTRGPDKEQPG
jgi:hypothetical protein